MSDTFIKDLDKDKNKVVIEPPPLTDDLGASFKIDQQQVLSEPLLGGADEDKEDLVADLRQSTNANNHAADKG